MKTALVAIAFLFAAAPAYACNPWAQTSTEARQDCLDRNMDEWRQQQAQERQNQALEDIAAQLRADAINRAAGY